MTSCYEVFRIRGEGGRRLPLLRNVEYFLPIFTRRSTFVKCRPSTMGVILCLRIFEAGYSKEVIRINQE